MTYAQGKKQIKNLASHGACLYSEGETAPLTVETFKAAINFMKKNKIQAITYEMRIPETDMPMGLRITSTGHVYSGSMEAITSL